MLQPTRAIVLCCFVAVFGGACSSDDDGQTPEGSSGGETSGGVEGIANSGFLTDFLTDDPVVAATVCVRDQPELPCATTTQNGAYQIAGLNPGRLILPVPSHRHLHPRHRGRGHRQRRPDRRT